jgi:hypothetical protein
VEIVTSSRIPVMPFVVQLVIKPVIPLKGGTCLEIHSDDILGARMLWKPKEARILKNFIDQPV